MPKTFVKEGKSYTTGTDGTDDVDVVVQGCCWFGCSVVLVR